NQATQALLGREPGPVLLSIPYNVQKERVDDSVLDAVHIPSRVASRQYTSTAELAGLLRAARSPVIIAGHGCIQAGARDVVSALSDTFNIPVTTSLKAKGVVAEGTPLALGCLGVTSNGDAYRYLVDHADLLVFLGAGFNERTSYLWDAKLLAGKKIAQVDRDAAQLGRVFQPDVAICGDIRAVMDDVFAALQADGTLPKARALLDGHQANAAQPASDDGANQAFRLMQAFYRQLAQRFPHNALVFDDNIVFAQTYFDVSDRNHYFPNTGISSLGHAIPSAIGARCFAKDSPTFAILGDGGFQMCCMEIMTAVNYGIPLNVVVINNGTLSLIRKNQFQLYGERYIDCDFVNPDFGLLAQSFGIQHYRV
ncbi:MAG: acetolactate synthase, partial [Hydrogenophilales bacterium 17-62-8]